MRAGLRVWAQSLALLALSCGGGGAEVEGPTHARSDEAELPPLTGAALLPEDAFLVLKVDLVRLRESSNWDVVESALLVAEENVARTFPSLGGGELRRWISLVDRVHVGLSPSAAGHPDTLIVVEGRFTGADASRALAALGGDQPLLRQQAGADVPTFASDEPPGEVALVEDGLGVAATSGRLSAVLGRHRSRQGQSILRSPALAAVVHRVNFDRDAVGVAVAFTPEAKAFFRPAIGSQARPALEAATAGAVRLGLHEGIDALAIINTDDPTVAADTVALLENQRDALSRQPIVGMVGLAPILNGLGMNAEDGDIRLSLRASHEDTRNILGRASGFIGLGVDMLLGDAAERRRPAAAPSEAP